MSSVRVFTWLVLCLLELILIRLGRVGCTLGDNFVKLGVLRSL